MGKNFSTYPKETEADQSRARRPGLVDSRYVFSISVPRSKGDEQICSLLSTESLGGGARNRLAGSSESPETPCGDASIALDKQSRINKKTGCVSMNTLCCCVVDASCKGGGQPSQQDQFKAQQEHGGLFWNWVKEREDFLADLITSLQ